MNRKRPNLSDRYQSLFNELTFSNDMLEAFSNSDSLYDRLSGGYAYDERILELEDKLKEEFWRIVDTFLTDRQKQIIKLRVDGYTQMEIAKTLKLAQSTINKCAVNKDKSKKMTGGYIKKIIKIVEEDEKILAILQEISEIRSEKW